MKRAKATLTEQYKIIEWLDFHRDKQLNNCPFITCFRETPSCKKFFPKMKEGCPCEQFPLKYVRKVAKQLILEVK